MLRRCVAASVFVVRALALGVALGLGVVVPLATLATVPVAVAAVTPPPTAIPIATSAVAPSPAAAQVDSWLNGLAKIAAAVVWPAAIIAVVALLATRLGPVLDRYLRLLTRRHTWKVAEAERLASARWEYSDSINITETVATVVGAAVAVRLIKSQGMIEKTPDFEKLRSIVRRMMQSINAGETRAIRARHIVWVHKEHIEDELEKNAFENLGAVVRFFTDNKSLITHVAEMESDPRTRDRIVAIVSNRKHWNTERDHNDQKDVDEESARDLLRRLRQAKINTPVFIYSRSLDEPYIQTLYQEGATLCTALPEMLIHGILQVANTPTRADAQNPPGRDRMNAPAAAAPVVGQEVTRP